MKKIMIILVGVLMTLTSCKTHLDSLASNTSDDVYFNPAKDRKPNVAPTPPKYEAQNYGYNYNDGKKAATTADQNNPYYKDPNFNYDDYYDNAYAARIKRFQQPLYGTGYYDSYYTNSYFYNQNPAYYGNSIYNSYNMGYSPYGYYSPSAAFNNYAYNPYYNGYGGYGGYGSGMAIGVGYGMGYGSSMYGSYGYNPYGMGYGCSPYGYGMGYGYSPYGYGYSPYGMGYGYNPYGYGGYSSPMYATGYYNSLDYNSGTYHYGPRGSHAGGNSPNNSPTPAPHHMVVNNPDGGLTNGPAPYATDRFSQVVIPKENYTKMLEAKNPSTIVNGNTYQPNNGGMYNNGEAPSNPVRYNPNYGGGSNYNNAHYNGGMNFNGGGGPVKGGTYSGVPQGAVENGSGASEPKPHKWFSGVSFGGDNSTPAQMGSTPSRSNAGGSWGGNSGGNSGGSWGGGVRSGGSSSGSGVGTHRGR
ncbi:MAG: hypothetical protein ACXVPN_11015 [Bacteroidia bacterium]